uniref:START domain-containing protein n=1 Tax=Hyaloperonospora arabidopsidis (strain Emoy2) TaxID=559515 RepID=M4B7P3_HYAAE
MTFESTVEITRGSVETKHGAPQVDTPVPDSTSALTFSIPAPIATVRANIQAFEEDSIYKLLQRYEGADVLPNGWRDGPHSKGIQVVYGEVDGSEWFTMKTTGTLHVSASKAAAILMRCDMVPKFDDMTKEVKAMEKLSDASEVRRVTAKSVMFTAARDFSVVSTFREEASGRLLIATRSVEYVAERKGYVRATIHISGYIVTPHATDSDMCELSVVAHMDLGGNLPAMVVRYLGLSAPIKLIEKIQEITMKA